MTDHKPYKNVDINWNSLLEYPTKNGMLDTVCGHSYDL